MKVETRRGVVSVQPVGVGSKSEQVATVLTTKERTWLLRRQGGPSFGVDPHLARYEGKSVEVSGYAGAAGKKSVIAGIQSKVCHVASYKVDHFTFRQLDPKTAVLVYRAEQDTTCGGLKVPSPVWATSLYQLRGGRWQNVLYEHTPVLVPPAKK